jgi:hypothetical protein
MQDQLIEIFARLHVRRHDRLPTVETDRDRLSETPHALGYVR